MCIIVSDPFFCLAAPEGFQVFVSSGCLDEFLYLGFCEWRDEDGIKPAQWLVGHRFKRL